MEDERKFPNFRDEVMYSMRDSIGEWVETDARAWEITDEEYYLIATSVLTRLRQLGAFHVDALTAIKEQEKE